jgi:nitroreductase
MDVYQAVVSKRDTREFEDRPVGEDDIGKVLQAARMAGSAKNQQLNRLVVVTDADDRVELSKCGKFADWVDRVPVMIVIVIPKDGGKLFDVGRMAQNMLVTAHSLGLASCPVTFHEEDRVRKLLAIPDDFEAPMGVGIGYPAPAGQEKEPSPRIPLDELVHWGRWED